MLIEPLLDVLECLDAAEYSKALELLNRWKRSNMRWKREAEKIATEIELGTITTAEHLLSGLIYDVQHFKKEASADV